MITKVGPNTMVVCAIVVVAVLLMGLCAMAQADITLASGGQSDYTIIIDRDCSPSERHGAQELQMFLEQICGAKLPIARVNVTGPKIFVGSSRALDRLALDIDFEALGDEGFVIQTVGPHLVLAGGRLRGTMYACYEFLDKFLGCRWFTAQGATPAVSRIPHQDTITLPNIDYKKIPILEYRAPYCPEARDGDWAARNRMNTSGAHLDKEHGGTIVYAAYSHTFYSLVPPDKYFKDHPEYFSEINGERVGEKAQLCLTNPDVVRIATETVRGWLRKSPEANIVSVAQNDYTGWCQCDRCQALADEEGSQSGPILHFVNQIADNIKDEFPHVAVITYAYQYSSKPPKHVKPRPNVIVQLCDVKCCFSHPLATCDSAVNAAFRENIEGWSKICNRLYIYDYVTKFAHYIMPFPNLYSLQPNIEFFVDHNVTGIFELGSYTTKGGEFAELRSYLLARSLWDPDCNWQKEMDEFLVAYYGAAGAPIRQYIDMLHEKVQKDNIHADCSWGPWRAGPNAAYLTEDIINNADKFFDEAEAAVADDPVLLLRVQKDRLPIQYVKIRRFEEFLPAVQEFHAVVEEFARIAHQWGITRISEFQTGLLDKNLEQWRAINVPEAVETHEKIAKGEATVYPLPYAWQFAIDRDDVGVSEKWFAPSFNDERWPTVYSDRLAGWETQGFPDYIVGFGWYRQAFDVPAELQQRQFVYLYFGAVDEDAYVYLNGEPAYEHSCASTGLAPGAIWTTPFAFDAHPFLRYGETNNIAVRVYNRAGMGGVWKRVYLIGADHEMDTRAMKAVLK